MKGFKDFVKSDIDTFINIDEFADIHSVNGKDIKCIFDEDITEDRSSGVDYRIQGGLFLRTKAIYVRIEDLEKPVITDRLTIDGDENFFTVLDVTEESGVYRILLERIDY